MNNVNYYTDDSILKQIKRSPFYNENINGDLINGLFQKLEETNLPVITTEMPDEWFAGMEQQPKLIREMILERLTVYINQKEYLTSALNRLKEVKIESEEEIKLRQLENRKKFEREILRKP